MSISKQQEQGSSTVFLLSGSFKASFKVKTGFATINWKNTEITQTFRDSFTTIRATKRVSPPIPTT